MDRKWIEAVSNRWRSRDHYVEFQFKFASELFSFYNQHIEFKNKKVLEIGCGMGGFSVFLALKGAKVTAVDSELYDKVLSTAKKFIKMKGVNVDFRLADAQKLEFPDNSFDAIVMNSVVEHLERPLPVLSECKRILKPGGKLFINFPLFYGPFGGHIDDFIKIPWYHLLPPRMVRQRLINKKIKKGILTGEHVAKVYGTLNRMTISKFRNYLKRLGFRIVAYKISPGMNEEGVRYLRLVQDSFRKKSPRETFEKLISLRQVFTFFTFLNFIFFLIVLPLTYIPHINEFFASAVTMVIEKPSARYNIKRKGD